VKNLFDLEVDVIFLGSTSTYFEIEGEDKLEGDGEGADTAGEAGASEYGH
jgi:hypothetical protein